VSATEPPSAAPTPTGAALWLLVALPYVVQLLAAGLGVIVVVQLGLMERGGGLFGVPQALLAIGSYVVFGVATWLVARRLGRPLDILAAVRTPLGPALAWSALALVAAFVAAAALEPLFGGAQSQRDAIGSVPGGLPGGVAIGLAAIAAIPGAAITEELYFRGLLLGALDRRLGTAAAIVGSAGAFGLAHFQPAAFPTLAVLGVILAVLRLRTASTLPCIAVHMANNAIALTAVIVMASA
jgi:membrane protease YdiL (CAAX protease family)